MPNASPTEQTDPRLIRLAPEDNVAAVTTTIEPGESLVSEGRTIEILDRVPTGHKVAVEAIPAGRHVIKYGASIGSATRDIRPGEYVHTHNLTSDYLPTYTLDGSNPYLREE